MIEVFLEIVIELFGELLLEGFSACLLQLEWIRKLFS